jgi:hypothetical protein
MDALGRTEIVEPGRITVNDPTRCLEYSVCGNCPVQAFGSILDRELYFRARHEEWSFEIADHKGELPSDGLAAADGFYREGDYPNAGYMPNEMAIKLIEKCLREYLE